MLMAKNLSILGMLSLLLIAGCAASPRYERGLLRELSLHAYDEGLEFAEQGNYDLALERFTRSGIISPRPASFFQQGRVYEELGDDEEAALSYLKALEGAPDFQEARFAILALGYDPPEESEIRADPGRLSQFADELLREVEFRRLEAEQAEGELTESERRALRERIMARMTLASEQRAPTISEVRALLFPGTGEGQDVPSATDPMYATDREVILNTFPFHFAKGQQFQRSQEYEKAAGEYQLALQVDPDQMEARLNLGDCMLRLERHPQAQFHYATAMEQFPDSSRPLLKMGNYYESLRQQETAREYYERAMARDPDYVEAYNNLAAIEIRDKNYAAAIEILERATGIRPGYALAYLNLGVAHENNNDTAAALEAYRRYVALGGDQAPEIRAWIEELE